MKLLEKIKLIYYDWILNKSNSTLTMIQKIEYIRINQVSLYDEKLNHVEIVSNYKTIFDYINYLESLLQEDLENQYVKKIINSGKVKTTTTLSNWCSIDRSLIPNEVEILMEWLLLVEKLYKRYYNMKGLKNIEATVNSNKLKPHIINMESIIDNIITHIQ